MSLHQALRAVESITLYDEHGNIDGELSLQEIRHSVEKRKDAIRLLFSHVTEEHIRDAHALINEASFWEVGLDILLNNRRFSSDERMLILQILQVAAGDELERSIRYDGISYGDRQPADAGHTPTEIIDLIIRAQAANQQQA
jgi:hypothetical protein